MIVIHRRKLQTRILATLFVQLITIPPMAWAKETLVANPAEFAKAAKNLRAGDTIILKNGLWKEKRLRIQANGTSDQPITLKAETRGKVILRGKSSISVAGSHLILDGLWFQNPSTSDAIELRVDDTPAIDCRITNCAVTDTRPLSSSKSVTRFISLYGSRNRVDHCYFAGKITGGPSLVVWLAANAESSHRIDHNHFGPREPLTKNGGETIRVGDSASSMLNATCIIEHNLFEKCNGETECISNKSCGNIYRNNTFKAVSGTLTL
jgi:poly(beta-D-mannuronate) lyase